MTDKEIINGLIVKDNQITTYNRKNEMSTN